MGFNTIYWEAGGGYLFVSPCRFGYILHYQVSPSWTWVHFCWPNPIQK